MPRTLGEAAEQDGVSDAFLAAAEMLCRRSGEVLKDKVRTETVGRWIVVCNGTTEKVDVAPEGTMGAEVPPLNIAVFYNGWWAGLLNPAGGWIAAGEAANEGSFIEAMRSAK